MLGRGSSPALNGSSNIRRVGGNDRPCSAFLWVRFLPSGCETARLTRELLMRTTFSKRGDTLQRLAKEGSSWLWSTPRRSLTRSVLEIIANQCSPAS